MTLAALSPLLIAAIAYAAVPDEPMVPPSPLAPDGVPVIASTIPPDVVPVNVAFRPCVALR